MMEFIFGNRNYYFVSFCLILVAIGLFIAIYEKGKPKTREIVILAVMISLAALGRTVFFMTPQFKPMGAVIIITAVAMGKEAGFMCGALSLFVSNMFFGQGPWTPWQMLAFGIMGFMAGVIFHKKLGYKNPEKKDITYLCIYGAISSILIYGLIMDVATVLMYTDRPTMAAIVSSCVAGFVFNVIHGASIVIFLLILAGPMLKKLNRIKKKFGMFYQ